MARLSTFSSLKHKGFQLFWTGSTISEIGSQMQLVAINWQIYELTHSALALGLVGLASFLPIPFFALLGGLVADKVDRKWLLIYSQIAQGLVAVILAYLTISGQITALWIYILIALTFVGKVFQAPARQAIIPQLVPAKDFMNAAALSVLGGRSSILIGPAIAGFGIEFWGVKSVYLFNAISFIFLIAALLPIKIDSSHIKNNVTYSFKSILEGIHFVKSNQILYSTMLLDFSANLFASATTMMPIFAMDILKIGASGLGIMYAAPSIGAVIAGLLIASYKRLNRPGWAILISVFIFGVATIGFGLSSNYYLSLLFLAVLGAGDMISTVLRNTIRQLITPDHLRGRMVSINMIFIQGGPQLGEFEAGILASLMGAPISVAIGGIGAVVSVILIGLLSPNLRNYRHKVGTTV